MIAEYGQIYLVLALAATVYATFAYFFGARVHSTDLVVSAKRATYAVTALITLAVIALQYAFMTDDFRFEYVAGYSSKALPGFYKSTAIWAGQAGSLLFWGWILILYTATVVASYENKFDRLMPYVLGTLMAVNLFFLFLVVFISKPFEMLPQAVADGRGLNPLLQHPAMAIHPPILYLGYVGFAVPFAFALGALLSGEIENRWVKTVRRWTLVPWFFLGIGMMLGGKWAYEELGWGGYWAWDPVENAAFMPWLTGTAFLHSIMIQEKKSMLKVWNMVLIFLTFILSIFGTFLTRSGVVSSVHSFTQSSIGPLFLSFVIFIAIVSFGILVLRRGLLKSESRIESVVSRESAFLINNVVFVGACFAVFWGTIFPVLSEAVRGEKITVGPPWFNAVNIPIFLFLLFLTGVGPLVAWRKSSLKYLQKHFLKPFVVMIIAAAVLVAFGIQHPYALLSFSLCVFVVATITAEFHRGARARMRGNRESYFGAMIGLVQKNQRRYGGYIVHFAIVLIFVGVTGAAFDKEVETALNEGERVAVGPFEVEYVGFTTGSNDHRQVFRTELNLYRNGNKVKTIYPERHYYFVQDQPTTEVALYYTLMQDFYAVFVGWDSETRSASFHFYLKPLVIWVWIGGMVLTLGTLIVIIPARKEREQAKTPTQREVPVSTTSS